jgi:hypothetical protein
MSRKNREIIRYLCIGALWLLIRAPLIIFNPFNPTTTIRYGLPARSHVKLTVFNTLGQHVSMLIQVEQDAGYHVVKFDGTGLPSGLYFYRVQAGDFVETRRLVLLR